METSMLERSWNGWPWDQRCGERPRAGDVAPERTASGDFVLFHSTTPKNAEQIMSQRCLVPDNCGAVGVGPSPASVRVYGMLKAGGDVVVLRIVLEVSWVSSQRVKHEIGGSGTNQWLFLKSHKTSTWSGIPADAIVDISLA